MKILILVSKLTGGGAERVASLWANGFAERGYDVGILISSSPRTPITYKVHSKVKIYNIWSLASLFPLKRLYIDKYSIKRTRDVILQFHPDIIIGVLRPWAEYARYATKGMNIPIINTEHNAFERPKDIPMPQADMVSKYEWNKHYSHVTVLTHADYECVKGVLNNVTVLPNPLAFKPIEIIPIKENVILAVGRLDVWRIKGFDVLIKAWGRIAKQHPEWKLKIVGEGKSKSVCYLKQLASENKVSDQIQLLDYKHDILNLYQNASIFVLASRCDGFGMVLIEAMSQGCAPIACDFKGRQREIIASEEEGLICPTNSVDSLASAIEWMIEDERYRQMVQKKAIERSKDFELERIMDKWDHIIKGLQ